MAKKDEEKTNESPNEEEVKQESKLAETEATEEKVEEQSKEETNEKVGVPENSTDENTETNKEVVEDNKKEAKENKSKKKNKEEEKQKEEAIEKAGEQVKQLVDENKDGYMSAREVVNALDDIKIAEKSADEIVADEVAEQLRERQEYFVFRVRKSIFLLITGLIVILLWLFTFAPFAKDLSIQNSVQSLISKIQPTSTPESTPTPTTEPAKEVTRIRIKVDGDVERASAISSILKENGFDTIDVISATVDEVGVSVAVKKGEENLRSKLMEILKDSYNAGSSSSELTDDSDFSAVILMAK